MPISKNLPGIATIKILFFALLIIVPFKIASAVTPPPQFVLFDNTSYPNSQSVFDASGMLRATVVYLQSTGPEICTADGCPNAPTETQFKQSLVAYVTRYQTSNTIVFDYENLVVSSENSAAAANNCSGFVETDDPMGTRGLSKRQDRRVRLRLEQQLCFQTVQMDSIRFVPSCIEAPAIHSTSLLRRCISGLDRDQRSER